jgi:hypothetical protein
VKQALVFASPFFGHGSLIYSWAISSLQQMLIPLPLNKFQGKGDLRIFCGQSVRLSPAFCFMEF